MEPREIEALFETSFPTFTNWGFKLCVYDINPMYTLRIKNTSESEQLKLWSN